MRPWGARPITTTEPLVRMDHAMAVWWRNVAVYRRTWALNLLPNFFEPVLYLVGMGLGLGAYLEGGFSGDVYLAFIGPGLMAAAGMNGAIFETTYNMFVRIHMGKVYDAYLTTPAMLTDIALGEVLWATTRAFIYGMGFWIILVAMSLAGRPILTSPWALLMPVALVLTGFLFSLVGAVYTAHIKNINTFSYFFTLFITPLFLFSGIFYPTDRFPFGDEIAWCTPLYHAVRLMRALANGLLDGRHVVDVIWMIVASAILAFLLPRGLRKRLVA